MSQIVQVKVLEPELRGGSREISSDGTAAIRKNAGPIAPLPFGDFESIETGCVEQRHSLMIADAVLRMLPIVNHHCLGGRIEVCPFQAAHLGDTHGARQAELQDVGHRNFAWLFLEIRDELLKLSVAHATFAVL